MMLPEAMIKPGMLPTPIPTQRPAALAHPATPKSSDTPSGYQGRRREVARTVVKGDALRGDEVCVALVYNEHLASRRWP